VILIGNSLKKKKTEEARSQKSEARMGIPKFWLLASLASGF
jgi:hypothetical protein